MPKTRERRSRRQQAYALPDDLLTRVRVLSAGNPNLWRYPADVVEDALNRALPAMESEAKGVPCG